MFVDLFKFFSDIYDNPDYYLGKAIDQTVPYIVKYVSFIPKMLWDYITQGIVAVLNIALYPLKLIISGFKSIFSSDAAQDFFNNVGDTVSGWFNP